MAENLKEKKFHQETLEDKAKTLQEWMDAVVYVRQGKVLVPENPRQVAERLVRLVDAEVEIDQIIQADGEDHNWIVKEKDEEIKKLQEKSDYYSHMYGKIALERDSLKKTMGQIRKYTKNFPELLSNEFGMLEVSRAWGYYERTKKWKEMLVGLFQEPKKEEK